MKTFPSLLIASSFVLIACGGAVAPDKTSGQGPGETGGPYLPAPQPTGGTPANPTPPPPAPSPGTWNAQASGCGNFTIYDGHSSGTKFIVIEANRAALGIAQYGDSTTVDLATTRDGASLAMDVYPRSPADPTYCSDIIIDPQKPIRWFASAGSAKFTITGLGREGDSYSVTVDLKDVVVVSPTGEREQIPDMTLKNVNVGWLPG
jgi:hypothetical protein